MIVQEEEEQQSELCQAILDILYTTEVTTSIHQYLPFLNYITKYLFINTIAQSSALVFVNNFAQISDQLFINNFAEISNLVFIESFDQISDLVLINNLAQI